MINYLSGVLLSHPRGAVQIVPGAVLSQTPESLLRSFPGCGMTDIAMHDGAGSFAFADDAGGVRRTLRVFYFRPKAATRDSRIVVAMHGLTRAGEEFRDVLAGPAERNGRIVLVPEFDLKQFPDAFAYNFGGVRLSPPSNTVCPRETWHF